MRILPSALGGLLALAGCATPSLGAEDMLAAVDAAAPGAVSDAAADASAAPDAAAPECDDELAACGALCVDLARDPTNCGACGRTCVIPRAEAACVAQACAVGGCEEGWADCDGEVVNGCERSASSCSDGAACMTGCGTQGTLRCDDVCAPSCTPPSEVCNVRDDDCDGTCDVGVPGCRHGVHRGSGHGHTYSPDLAHVSTAPYSIEGRDYFFAYSNAGPGLLPLFRCPKFNGTFFLTTDTACEVGVAPVETVGFVSPNAVCGSTPLFRLRTLDGSNHFYTFGVGERDAAIAGGYISEGIAAHVWRAP